MALMAWMVVQVVTSVINRAQILFAATQQLCLLFCFLSIIIIAPAWTIALYLKREKSSNIMPIVPPIEYYTATLSENLLETRYDDVEKMQFEEPIHPDLVSVKDDRYFAADDAEKMQFEEPPHSDLVSVKDERYLAADDAEKMQFEEPLHSDLVSVKDDRYFAADDVEKMQFEEPPHSDFFNSKHEIRLGDKEIRKVFKRDGYVFNDEGQTFSKRLVISENDDPLSIQISLDDRRMMFIYDKRVNYENKVENIFSLQNSWGGKEVWVKMRKDESESYAERIFSTVNKFLHGENSSSSGICLEDKENKQMFKKDEFLSGEKQIFHPCKNEANATYFCEICLENKESWQMFRNNNCSHSFCYECTTNYISAKIQERVTSISCPAVNCKTMLNSNVCRVMIPRDILVKWDETQCMSLIRESSKLYCPFRDCLAMIVNDNRAILGKVKCVACKRKFCAECGVPWHIGLSCKLFQTLYRRKENKNDKIVKKLAKVNNWQKCRRCKMIVEKIDGCVHMKCRCEYEFCYRCGSKWSKSHKCW